MKNLLLLVIIGTIYFSSGEAIKCFQCQGERGRCENEQEKGILTECAPDVEYCWMGWMLTSSPIWKKYLQYFIRSCDRNGDGYSTQTSCIDRTDKWEDGSPKDGYQWCYCATDGCNNCTSGEFGDCVEQIDRLALTEGCNHTENEEKTISINAVVHWRIPEVQPDTEAIQRL